MFRLWASFISMHRGLNIPMWRRPARTARRSESQAARHWMLLLSSVPLASDMFIFPMEWPTWFTPSLRGGMRSLMRSRPLASSKLVILCCGENPRMATRRKRTAGIRRKRSQMMAFRRGRNFAKVRASDRFGGGTSAATRGVLSRLARQTLQRSRLSLVFVHDKGFKNAKRRRVFLEGNSGTSSAYINVFNDPVFLSVPDVAWQKITLVQGARSNISDLPSGKGAFPRQ